MGELELLGFPEECIVPTRNSTAQLYFCRPVPGVGSTLYWMAGSYSLWFFRWDSSVYDAQASGITANDSRCIEHNFNVESLIQASALIYDFIQRNSQSNSPSNMENDNGDW